MTDEKPGVCNAMKARRKGRPCWMMIRGSISKTRLLSYIEVVGDFDSNSFSGKMKMEPNSMHSLTIYV